MQQLATQPAQRVSSHFDVSGFQLTVDAENADLLAPVKRLMGPFLIPVSGQSSWRLAIRRDPSALSTELPPDVQEIWSGEVPPGFVGTNSVGPGKRHFELSDSGCMQLDLVHREATITLSPECPAARANYFATTLMCEGLIAAGHGLLHAACLEVPWRGKKGSLLIVAKGGTGKSTTALALADAGWRLMGDDITLVSHLGDSVATWGFPRVCHVRRPTLELLPWLNEMPLVPTSIPGTFDLALESLGRRACVPYSCPLEPALIVCLERPNPNGHRCTRLDRAAALMHVAEENVQPVEGCEDPSAQRCFTTFARLVQHTAACRLSVGPRVDGLAEFLTPYVNG